MQRRTYSAKPSDIQKEWHVIDAEGLALGRIASRVSRILMGKHRPEYTPHLDTGDFVVIVNAEKVYLSGKKSEQKQYHYHTGYAGGLREIPVKEMLERKPEEVIRLAVRRMLPKTKLGRQMITKLKVYAGPDHPHAAQQPRSLDIENFKG